MGIDPVVYGYMVSEETYPDKAVIIEEGSAGDWAFVVLQGKVKVIKKVPNGVVTIDTLTEGAVFGEMAMFKKGVPLRTASVVADGSVQVGVLDKDRLLAAYAAASPRLKVLIEATVARLEDTTNAITRLVCESDSSEA